MFFLLSSDSAPLMFNILCYMYNLAVTRAAWLVSEVTSVCSNKFVTQIIKLQPFIYRMLLSPPTNPQSNRQHGLPLNVHEISVPEKLGQ